VADREQTYFMIKPEIVAAQPQQIGAILQMVSDGGFLICGLALRTLPRALVEDFYGEHRGKPFYGDLVQYIAGGPVVAVRLEAEDAVPRLRELIGATDPAKAMPGTVRARFGASMQNNAVHASANRDDAARELALVFGAGVS